MFNKIKWLYRRHQYRKLFSYEKPHVFRIVKEGLLEVLEDIDHGRQVSRPELGICFNARFIHCAGMDPRQARGGVSYAFLKMANLFNKVHGRPFHKEWAPAHPFADVDEQNNRQLWKGPSLEIRIQAMRWILNEIDTYRLDLD